jgi:S-formylglutathione hydrolase FrmB
MPAVEAKYKFNGKRAVAGLSMGGYGTLYHALKYPSKFTYAYAMSPATDVESFKTMIDAQADKKVFPPFTIEVGTEDTTVNNADSKKLAEYMNEKGFRCEWIARTGIHYWNFWQECLPKTLQKVGETF